MIDGGEGLRSGRAEPPVEPSKDGGEGLRSGRAEPPVEPSKDGGEGAEPPFKPSSSNSVCKDYS